MFRVKQSSKLDSTVRRFGKFRWRERGRPMAANAVVSEPCGMPSPKLLIGRYSQIGDVYSVTTATSEREPLFESEQSARLVIAAIRYCERNGLSESLAWVVMPEHVHWLFMLRRGTLGVCVQRFKSISARQINARISTQGLLWQRGYYEHRLRDDEDVLAQVRYIVTNPLRRGLAVRIEDYPYWWARDIRSGADL